MCVCKNVYLCPHACVTEQILRVNKTLVWEFSQCLHSSDCVPYCTLIYTHIYTHKEGLIVSLSASVTGVVPISFTDEAALN